MNNIHHAIALNVLARAVSFNFNVKKIIAIAVSPNAVNKHDHIAGLNSLTMDGIKANAKLNPIIINALSCHIIFLFITPS